MSVSEPLYGVELTNQELTPAIPSSVLYGVTPNNKFIPINIDDQGRLGLASGITVSGDITIGDVVIKGVDPDNSNAQQDIAVKNLGAGNGFAVRSAIYGPSGTPLLVNNDGSVNVNVITSTPGQPVNVFNRVIGVPSASDQTILTYVVPAGKTFHITQLIAWGDYDGEFLLRVGAVLVGGGRTSGANRTIQLDYQSAPIFAAANSIVTITIRHYASSTESFSANLLGGLF